MIRPLKTSTPTVPSNDALCLIVLESSGPRRYALKPGRTQIGSAEGNDIALRERTVSRQHAWIDWLDGTLRLGDLGSSNGTRVNGERIEGECPLQIGDALAFGFVEARIERGAAGDAVVGIGSRGGRAPIARAEPAPTVLPQLATRFAFEQLPDLLERLAEGASPAAMAAAIGASLCRLHESIGVLITRAGSARAVLFHHRGESSCPFRGQIDELTLELGGGPALDPDSLERIGRMALALLAVSRRVPAGVDRSPTRSTMPTALPGPPPLDPAVRRLYAQAERVAGSELPVLIQGESGTGKELLAQYVHAASPRATAPLVALNCAALPRDLLELELFGIEEGVATGVKARPGRFEQADGGTLFLDEIGDLALEAQAKLLRVLQEQEVLRIGAQRARPARVRIISATHHDLRQRVESGQFRLDLYHRIAAWKAVLPPLRERPADLPALALHFLEAACARHGVRPTGISERALALMQAYPWPGNIRQLQTEMARAALFLADGELLDSSLLHEDLQSADPMAKQPAPQSLEAQLEQAERQAIAQALQACDGQVERAAQQLGLPRSTLYRRITALGLRE
ncbi:MAG: sigma 54-interacting transcriptional regulator [Xanthomonadales bacterium]|jgi:DNA-binding NtrC family response regulator|nr:sigma 54-interacting transcriptional regulator [Xanthomonadales bacterium]